MAKLRGSCLHVSWAQGLLLLCVFVQLLSSAPWLASCISWMLFIVSILWLTGPPTFRPREFWKWFEGGLWLYPFTPSDIFRLSLTYGLILKSSSSIHCLGYRPNVWRTARFYTERPLSAVVYPLWFIRWGWKESLLRVLSWYWDMARPGSNAPSPFMLYDLSWFWGS